LSCIGVATGGMMPRISMMLSVKWTQIG
jgi:hypothetical protein